jgi:peptidoglycan/LPS O-acetylase OafA/YrhL
VSVPGYVDLRAGPAETATAASKHVKSLDGIRGWAALAVVFYHGLLHYDISSIERVLYRSAFYVRGVWDLILKLLLTVMNGESAVLVFFVLSGYVLRLSLNRSATTNELLLTTEFVIKRICRLFPALVVAVVGFRILGSLCNNVGLAAFPLVSWVDVAKNSLLREPVVIGPSWSIQTEFAATAVILAGFFLRRWFGFIGLVMLSLYATFAIDFPMLLGGIANLWPYALGFVLGMIVAEGRVVELLRTAAGPNSQLLYLVGFLFGRHLVERAGVSGLIAQTVFAALLVGSLTAHSSGILSRYLSSPVSQFMGRISYSLYLINVIWLYFFWAILPVPATDNIPQVIFTGLASAFGALLITIPLSQLNYKWVEVPFIKLGNLLAAYVQEPPRRHKEVSPQQTFGGRFLRR